ncbi:MAG: hypothetical protein ACI9Y1_001684 [Lentisphaeria bacterium]|jgi:hypothetical protein
MREPSLNRHNAWVMDYLYGELTAAQKHLFEATLLTDEQLRNCYEAQCELDQYFQQGCAQEISDERMQGVRWAIMRRLRQGQQENTSWLSKSVKGLQAFLPSRGQLAAMTCMFVAGFHVNLMYTSEHKNSGVSSAANSQIASANTGPLEFGKDSDYSIVDLNLD